MSRRGLIRGERRKIAIAKRDIASCERRGLKWEHPFMDAATSVVTWAEEAIRLIRSHCFYCRRTVKLILPFGICDHCREIEYWRCHRG